MWQLVQLRPCQMFTTFLPPVMFVIDGDSWPPAAGGNTPGWPPTAPTPPATCGVWHCWHSIGGRALSMAATVLPCGLWQMAQLSCTGACVRIPSLTFSARVGENAAVSAGVGVLAVQMRRRTALLPNAPTMAELGYSLQGIAWAGILAPAGTPAPIVARLSAAVVDAVADAGVQTKLRGMGGEPGSSSSEEFADRLRRDGVVEKIGLSNVNRTQLEEALGGLFPGLSLDDGAWKLAAKEDDGSNRPAWYLNKA